MEKIDRSYLRYIRYFVQWAVFFFLIYAGYRFYQFVIFFSSLQPGSVIPVPRPPSVEGFLPISALMSLKLWVLSGYFDSIHPAALVIFIAALAMAFLLRKSFCGWICPVGAFSDLTWKLGRRLFKKNFTMNRYIDFPLRSLKYILMLFFIYVIAIKMPSYAILEFIGGDYYKIADVKMLYFFTKMTTTTLVILLILFLLSMLYKNFWCRYLCPYGALLGILAICSPLRITRNEDLCTHCSSCTRNCPSQLPVEEKRRIISPECTGCLTCVSRCPSKGALDIAFTRKKILNPFLFVFLLLVLFFGTIGIGKITDKWNSAVTHEEYRQMIPKAEILEHP